MPSGPESSALTPLPPFAPGADADPVLADAARSILGAATAGVTPPHAAHLREALEGEARGLLLRLADRAIIRSFRASFRAFAVDAASPAARTPPPPRSAPLSSITTEALRRAASFELRVVDRTRDADRAPVEPAPIARLQPESRTREPKMLRLQLSRGDHFAYPNSGDAADMACALLEALPATPAAIALAHDHVAPFLETVRARALRREAPVAIVAIASPPSQWARDNASAVHLPGGEPAWLLPARATRGDLPGERLPVDEQAVRACVGLSEISPDFPAIAAAHSDLEFQGGDLTLFEHPALGRVLLIGEAEIVRNIVPGDSIADIAAKFKRQFGADRVHLLPSVSFHIDYECAILSPLSTDANAAGDRPTAFVNDADTAAQLLLLEALTNMERAGELGRAAALAARGAAARLDAPGLLASLGPVLASFMQRDGRFAEPLAAAIAGPGLTTEAATQSRAHIASARRVLCALDALVASSIAHATPVDSTDPMHAYFRALARQRHDREVLVSLLGRAGCAAVRVPSNAEDDCSANAINMVFAGRSVLIPAIAKDARGSLHPLASGAAQVVRRRTAPDAAIQPVFSDESQCRQGGVHCTVSVCN